MGDGLDTMEFHKEHSEVLKGNRTCQAALGKQGDILVGEFVDRDRPDYLELMRRQMSETAGDRYVRAELPICV